MIDGDENVQWFLINIMRTCSINSDLGSDWYCISRFHFKKHMIFVFPLSGDAGQGKRHTQSTQDVHKSQRSSRLTTSWTFAPWTIYISIFPTISFLPSFLLYLLSFVRIYCSRLHRFAHCHSWSQFFANCCSLSFFSRNVVVSHHCPDPFPFSLQTVKLD